MNVIITGGAGFIGSNMIFYWLGKYPEDRVICVDKLTYAGNLSTLDALLNLTASNYNNCNNHNNDNNYNNHNADHAARFRFYKTDICDRAEIEHIFEIEKPDLVINFAAESHVDRSIENPAIFLQTNIIGTSVLMASCRKYGAVRFHQVSTDEVYGDLPLDRPDLFFTEETPIHTSSPYSSSKAGADLLVL